MSSQQLDIAAQACISILGIWGLWLVSKKNKWGFVVGLAAQPFWFFTTWLNRQWIIFGLSVIYAVVWTNGIRNYFWPKPAPNPFNFPKVGEMPTLSQELIRLVPDVVCDQLYGIPVDGTDFHPVLLCKTMPTPNHLAVLKLVAPDYHITFANPADYPHIYPWIHELLERYYPIYVSID